MSNSEGRRQSHYEYSPLSISTFSLTIFLPFYTALRAVKVSAKQEPRAEQQFSVQDYYRHQFLRNVLVDTSKLLRSFTEFPREKQS